MTITNHQAAQAGEQIRAQAERLARDTMALEPEVRWQDGVADGGHEAITFPAFELADVLNGLSHLLERYCEAKGTAPGSEALVLQLLFDGINVMLEVLWAAMDEREPERRVLDKLNSTRDILEHVSPRPVVVGAFTLHPRVS